MSKAARLSREIGPRFPLPAEEPGFAAAALSRYTALMETLAQVPEPRAKAASRSLAVLLVEDEVLIRMTIADMLEELGHRVVGEAGDIESASSFAMTAEYDLAILDINLHGRYVDPVADLIALCGKPFLFASGHGPEVLPSLLRRRPLLRKPVVIEDLRLTIEKIFDDLPAKS